MTVLSLPARPVSGIFDGISDMFEIVRVAYRVSSDFSRLNALSDRRLADLGMRREDLPRMLFDKHYR